VRSHYHRSLQQNDQALRDADQAVALSKTNPELSNALYVRAQVYAAMQMTEREIEDLEHIRLVAPAGTWLARQVQERLAALRGGATT
jgi:tetratricopeptide (TPR) repeat protein